MVLIREKSKSKTPNSSLKKPLALDLDLDRLLGGYSSSLLRDLKDCTHHKGTGCPLYRGTAHPFEGDNTPRTANTKEHATSRLIQTGFRVYGYGCGYGYGAGTGTSFSRKPKNIMPNLLQGLGI